MITFDLFLEQGAYKTLEAFDRDNKLDPGKPPEEAGIIRINHGRDGEMVQHEGKTYRWYQVAFPEPLTLNKGSLLGFYDQKFADFLQKTKYKIDIDPKLSPEEQWKQLYAGSIKLLPENHALLQVGSAVPRITRIDQIDQEIQQQLEQGTFAWDDHNTMCQEYQGPLKGFRDFLATYLARHEDAANLKPDGTLNVEPRKDYLAAYMLTQGIMSFCDAVKEGHAKNQKLVANQKAAQQAQQAREAQEKEAIAWAKTSMDPQKFGVHEGTYESPELGKVKYELRLANNATDGNIDVLLTVIPITLAPGPKGPSVKALAHVGTAKFHLNSNGQFQSAEFDPQRSTNGTALQLDNGGSSLILSAKAKIDEARGWSFTADGDKTTIRVGDLLDTLIGAKNAPAGILATAIKGVGGRDRLKGFILQQLILNNIGATRSHHLGSDKNKGSLILTGYSAIHQTVKANPGALTATHANTSTPTDTKKPVDPVRPPPEEGTGIGTYIALLVSAGLLFWAGRASSKGSKPTNTPAPSEPLPQPVEIAIREVGEVTSSIRGKAHLSPEFKTAIGDDIVKLDAAKQTLQDHAAAAKGTPQAQQPKAPLGTPVPTEATVKLGPDAVQALRSQVPSLPDGATLLDLRLALKNKAALPSPAGTQPVPGAGSGKKVGEVFSEANTQIGQNPKTLTTDQQAKLAKLNDRGFDTMSPDELEEYLAILKLLFP